MRLEIEVRRIIVKRNIMDRPAIARSLLAARRIPQNCLGVLSADIAQWILEPARTLFRSQGMLICRVKV